MLLLFVLEYKCWGCYINFQIFSVEVDTFYLSSKVHELLLFCKLDPKVNFSLQLKKLQESNYKT
jgi:hypothetical protein